jgi:trimethylamine:corrinoid methyltransferase-like protein
MDNFRTAQWIPEIIDRRQFDVWEASGSKDMRTRAGERAREILADHSVPALPDEAEAVIKDVLEERAG